MKTCNINLPSDQEEVVKPCGKEAAYLVSMVCQREHVEIAYLCKDDLTELIEDELWCTDCSELMSLVQATAVEVDL